MGKQFKKGIHFYQKGGDQTKLEKLKKASMFFSKELMSTRMINTLAIRIEMRATGYADRHTTGNCNGDIFNGSQASKEFTLKVQRDNSFESQLRTLAHELVHVQQYASKRLQTRFWKSDRKWHDRWEGTDMGVQSSIEYGDRPWEIEAFEKANQLKSTFLKISQ